MKKPEELIKSIEKYTLEIIDNTDIDYTRTIIAISNTISSVTLEEIARNIVLRSTIKTDAARNLSNTRGFAAIVSSIIVLNSFINRRDNVHNVITITKDNIVKEDLPIRPKLIVLLLKYHVLNSDTEGISFEDLNLIFNYCIQYLAKYGINLLYLSYYEAKKLYLQCNN